MQRTLFIKPKIILLKTDKWLNDVLVSSGIALFMVLYRHRVTLDLLRRHAKERWEPADLDLSQLFIHVCTANWYRIR